MAQREPEEKFVERLSRQGEEALGRIAEELIENPVVNGALTRALEAREKAVQAQEAAMGALNSPSAADIERLTRRLRSVSHRLEGIEDGLHELNRAMSPAGVEARLSAIERQLERILQRLDQRAPGESAKGRPPKAAAASEAPSNGT